MKLKEMFYNPKDIEKTYAILKNQIFNIERDISNCINNSMFDDDFDDTELVELTDILIRTTSTFNETVILTAYDNSELKTYLNLSQFIELVL
jgi:hypothetical protein